MSKRFLCVTLILAALAAAALFRPLSAQANAATARLEVSATVREIDLRVAEIKSLKSAKKLSEAFTKLHDLNVYIQGSLGSIFYDRIQEVLREDPSYTPPTVVIDLGVEFTEAYWETKVQVAEGSLQNAVTALSGLPSMATLDFQDQAWAWLKTIKDTAKSIKDIYGNIVTFDPIGLFKDGYDGVNGFIENMTAIENANLQNLNRDLFRSQVNTLVSRAKKNVELMKDAKSAMLVYRMEIITLRYNVDNIAKYIGSVKQDPVWPLNFSNTLYKFDPAPHTQAVDRLMTGFLARGFCWAEFVKIYEGIRREALVKKNQIEININGSPEPPGNKSLYLIDLAYDWGYFDDYAAVRYTAQNDARTAALARHNDLSAAANSLRGQRGELAASFWSTAGFTREVLETFDEQAEGIVQTNLPYFSGPSPYFFGREYNPSFPRGPIISSTEMPSLAPSVSDFSFREYPAGLIQLAKAYRVMAEAALIEASEKIDQGSNRPVAIFAKSPLSRANRLAVETNLQKLRIQADHYASFMGGKHQLIPAIEAKQGELVSAEMALVDHARENWTYLCADPDMLQQNAASTWDDLHIPILLADWDAETGVAAMKTAIESHLDYIAGQDDLNRRIDQSVSLIARMQHDANLTAVVNFIVSDHNSLPDFPSEQGYRDFLTELAWVNAFYGLGDLNRIMDQRQEVKEIFREVYSDGSPLATGWLTRYNPYCVAPESEAAFQALINQVGRWSDVNMTAVRQGFPGWDAWAKRQLALDWPAGNTDDVRPNVLHFTPGRNGEMVSLYQVIRVDFSKTMDPATLIAPKIGFTANGTPRPMSARFDKSTNTLFIEPGRMLPGTVYTVTLTEACTDLAGNALLPETWSFTTQTLPPAAAGASIEIGGIADGGSYSNPVTLAIAASGGYSALLSVNGQAAEPVVTGTTFTLRGSYELVVTDHNGVSRTLSFTIDTVPEGVVVDRVNFYTAPARPHPLSDAGDLAVGERYLVDGNRYYYSSGRAVYRFDLLTGQDVKLFDAGDYYTSRGGVNVVDPTTSCSFLGVSGDLILYVKNIGTEGPGVPPEQKLFQLFVYDQQTGRSQRVPTPAGLSLLAGRIAGRSVAWMDAHTGSPAIYRWDMDGGAVFSVVDLPGLETWQRPELLGFDGQWLLYRIGDGGDYTTVQAENGMTRTPRGESLHARNTLTGQTRTVVARDPARPVRVPDAALAAGRAAYMVYESRGVYPPEFWEDTCTVSSLSLMHLASGNVMPVSAKPQANFGFSLSGSLLYFTDRISPPPYSLDLPWASEITSTVYDLFSYRSSVATVDYHYRLFGDRMVSDHDAPRVILYASAASAVTMTGRTPAPDAVGVAATAQVTATFSAPLDPATLTGEFIALSRVDPNGTFIERVPVAITYDPVTNTVAFTPAGLVSGARYRAAFTGGFRDAAGQTVTAPALWHFTVADTTGPTLLSSSPPPGSTRMAPAAGIVLRFDETVNSATAAAGVRLSTGGSAVAFNAYGGGEGVLTITPTAPLADGQTYTIEVLAGLTDTAGNGATPTSFSFTATTPGAALPQGTAYAASTMTGINAIALPGLMAEQLAGSTSAMNLEANPAGDYLYLIDPMRDLKVMEIATKAVATLAAGVPAAQTPVFPPTGSRIIYSKDKEGVFGHEIISNNLTGGDPRVLLDFPSGSVNTLALSPDGARIAFTHAEGSNSPRLGAVDIAQPGQAVYLPEASALAWSPDGTRLYAVARTAATGFRDALVELNPALSLVRVVREMAQPQAWTISPTGTHLATFLSDGIYLVDLLNGSMRQILVCGQANMQSVPRLIWTRDGASLIFNATGISGTWSPGLYVLDVAQGKTAEIYTVQGGMPGMPMAFRETGSAPALPGPVAPAVRDQSTGTAVSISLDWSTYNGGALASQYRVYRAEEPFTGVAGMTPLGVTTDKRLTDTSAGYGKTYYYAVTPVTAAGWERKLVNPVGPVRPGDNDALDDAWEILHFGSLAADPAADPDQDGLANLAEQREGTNPNHPDTDGDLARDGVEITRGMNPLVRDVAPLTLAAQGTEVAVSRTLALETHGGSGSHDWIVQGVGQATVDASGVLTGTFPGVLTVTARDLLFTGLLSNPLTVNILAEPFGIRPQPPVRLQAGGHLTLRAVGGSGFHEWILSPGAPATAAPSGDACVLSSTAAAGSFDVTLTDLMAPERTPVSVTVTIGAIPGDLNGDSWVRLDDAILCMQVLTRPVAPAGLNLNGDANGDGRVGPADALYILQNVAGMR